jgi:hypothetical protein
MTSNTKVNKTNMTSNTKVKRAKMFNLHETEVITEFMKINLPTLKASHAQGGPGAAPKVSKVRERLTEEVNTCGKDPNTSKQVKEMWRNMVYFYVFSLSHKCNWLWCVVRKMFAMLVLVTVRLPSCLTWVKFKPGKSAVIAFDVFYTIAYRRVTRMVTVTMWYVHS